MGDPGIRAGGRGLPKPSIVKAAKLFTIHQRLIKRAIGAVPVSSIVNLLEKVPAEFQADEA